MEDVLEVYTWPDRDDIQIVYMDEVSTQLLDDIRESVPAQPGQLARPRDQRAVNRVVVSRSGPRHPELPPGHIVKKGAARVEVVVALVEHAVVEELCDGGECRWQILGVRVGGAGQQLRAERERVAREAGEADEELLAEGVSHRAASSRPARAR